MLPNQLQAVIERRLLVNYRVDPEVAVRHLPEPFRPQLIDGWAVAGICLIRLRSLRPRIIPVPLGLTSENAAHRIAVEWDHNHGTASGVYIPRRDTTSRVTTAVGGRIYPGVHHRASFTVQETDNQIHVGFRSRDDSAVAAVDVATSDTFSPSPLFHSLDAASTFFEQGAIGYSATNRADRFHGLELRTSDWQMHPVDVLSAQSSLFDDTEQFPPGSATLDG